MNNHDYGHHASGYRNPEPGEPSRGFMRRLAFWGVVLTVCLIWVMTHAGCAHPLGNTAASLVGFGFVPLRLVCIVLAEAGVE